VAQKVKKYQIIKNRIKSVHGIRFPRHIKVSIKHYNIIRW